MVVGFGADLKPLIRHWHDSPAVYHRHRARLMAVDSAAYQTALLLPRALLILLINLSGSDSLNPICSRQGTNRRRNPSPVLFHPLPDELRVRELQRLRRVGRQAVVDAAEGFRAVQGWLKSGDAQPCGVSVPRASQTRLPSFVLRSIEESRSYSGQPRSSCDKRGQKSTAAVVLLRLK
jgi:hypothetical protein